MMRDDQPVKGGTQSGSVHRRQGFMATSVTPPLDYHIDILEPGTQLGPWRVLELIDAGGMGQVYRGERADGLYEQEVAIKLVGGLDPEQRRRFDVERQRLASLEHPGIAAIIDGGSSESAGDGSASVDGNKDCMLYMVMQLVRGEPIDSALDRRAAGRATRVTCFLAVCAAVAYAHERLIVHRDIKPGNVLLDNDLRPRLIDFGIADDLGSGAASGGRALTVQYAAPELMRSAIASVQTDLFALGMLLYQILVGELPLRDETGAAIVDAASLGDADLAAIIRKCTHCDPQQRYSAVGLLIAELEAWQACRPVAARAGGRLYRTGRFLRRYPLASGFALTAVLALALGLGFSLRYGAEASREATRANAALLRADYLYRKADAFLLSQTVLNDVLQTAFAGESRSTDEVTQVLRSRWNELHQSGASNARDAAAMAFALGRSFYDRRDFNSTVEVLSTWLDAGYGDQALRDSGTILKAIAMHDGGYGPEALPMLRASLTLATATWQPTIERFSLASRIANNGGEANDTAVAINLYEALQKEQESGTLTARQLIDIHSTAVSFYELMQRYDAAITALEALVAVCTDNPKVAPGTRALARTHLGRAQLYALDDPEATLRTARAILNEDVPIVGESITTAHAYMLLGDALRELGRYDEAILALDQAEQLNKRYADGVKSSEIAAVAMRARVFIDQGEAGSARELLTDLESRWRAENIGSSELPTTLLLMQLWTDAVLGVDPQALRARASQTLTPSAIRPIHEAWMYRRALRAGLLDTLTNKL